MTSVTDDPSQSLEETIQHLEKTINDFNALVQKPESSADQNLWYAWRFLQIYSIYGLRLQHTEASLSLKLGISEPGQFPFFGTMKEGYNEIHEASDEFVSQIFPKVIEVGTSLLDFASEASENDGNIFSVLIELIESNDTQGALELIRDIQKTTKTNTEKAGTVKDLLGSYKGKLASAKAKVDQAQEAVLADERTSEAKIAKLNGDPNVDGSLANLRKQITDKKAEYEYNVTVASTTTTYAWVSLIGLIAAAVLAGVYGEKAVKALNEMHRLEDELAKSDLEMHTALQVNRIQDNAITSLKQTEHYTDLAITHTTTVQNAWEAISNNLSYVANKVADMTKEKDESTVLKTKALVKSYAEYAGKRWALLIPPLKELTRDPYIVVAEGEKSLVELATEVQKEIEIAKQAA